MCIRDSNTIIYGHNMRDGSMFSTLVEYKAQAYYCLLYTSTAALKDDKLAVEASDDMSGVEAVYVDDTRINSLVNGKAEGPSQGAKGAEIPVHRPVALCGHPAAGDRGLDRLAGRRVPGDAAGRSVTSGASSERRRFTSSKITIESSLYFPAVWYLFIFFYYN